MIALNYDRRVVLVLFAQANGGDLAPTAAQIGRFDQELHKAFETLLLELLPQHELPVDVETKSQVLAYRPHMPGNNAPLQLDNACTYFANTNNL